MRSRVYTVLAIAALIAACSPDNPTSTPEVPSFAQAAGSENAVIISPALVAMNNRLAARSSKLRVDHAEWIVNPDGGQDAGQTVYANNRSHYIGTKWVPADPNREWSTGGLDLSYLVDQSDGVATGGLTNTETEPAIDRAMNTWNAQSCSLLHLTKIADPGFDPDFTDGLLGEGDGIGTTVADITEAGWLPAAFFDSVAPGGSAFILAVTYTFIFVDEDGNPVDTNHDLFLDTALKEVYYNNNFPWAINGRFDVQTVALHENGHSLEIGHFGKIFRTLANGALHFSPRAVMNAAYGGVLQAPQGTDNSSYCGLFGRWPN